MSEMCHNHRVGSLLSCETAWICIWSVNAVPRNRVLPTRRQIYALGGSRVSIYVSTPTAISNTPEIDELDASPFGGGVKDPGHAENTYEYSESVGDRTSLKIPLAGARQS